MVDLHPVLPYSSVTIIPTKQRWIWEVNTTTPPMQTPMAPSALRMSEQVSTPCKPGQTAVVLATSQPHISKTISGSATSKLRLDKLTWPIPTSNTIFQIGAFDRKSTGFAFSGGFGAGRVNNCPANLTYTIGSSAPSDWCFAQNKIGTYRISFPLAASNTTSDALLTVSLAGYSQGTTVNIYANDVRIGNLSSSGILSDPSLYRSGTVAGEWHQFEFPIDGSNLKKSNAIDFRVSSLSSSLWRGPIYDAIKLEWI
jgi:rhamnogalacturonan endolyase